MRREKDKYNERERGEERETEPQRGRGERERERKERERERKKRGRERRVTKEGEIATNENPKAEPKKRAPLQCAGRWKSSAGRVPSIR